MSTATTHINRNEERSDEFTNTLKNKKEVSKIKLVPALRFKEFDIEWEKKKLGDVGKIRMCKRIFNSDTTEVGDIPFYKIGTFGKQANAYISNELYLDYRERFSFPKIGDILMSASGTLGRTVIYEGSPSYYQDSNIVWIDNEEEVITNLFLFYIYQIVRYDSEGGTIQRLYNSIINKAKFSKPSHPEQQKIASFLSAVDEKIQQLTKKKALLEQYKKGVMQQLFSGQLRFKDKNGNSYPDWEENKRLGALTYKVGKKNRENIQYPIYSINNQEGFRPQSEQFDGLDSNDRGYDISLYKIVESETFAYNPARINVGSIGYSYDLQKVIVSSLYVCFKTNEELEDLFLLAYLDTYNFHKNILRYEEGGVRQYLFYDNFSHIKIPIPSTEEQQKIATYLSRIDTKIESVNNQITQNQTFKKGLLQQMFV
tara:strand:- start:1559 stop:2839 length:1281 start_codon:yes stop_codon:yes gene_type:complete